MTYPKIINHPKGYQNVCFVFSNVIDRRFTSYRNDDPMSSDIIIMNTIVDTNGIKSVIVCTDSSSCSTQYIDNDTKK